MNSINFTPNYSVSNVKSANKIQQRPAFKGIQQVANGANAKKTASFLGTAYKLLFLPFSEHVASISDGTVKTVSKDKKIGCITIKNYPMWKKKPTLVTNDYPAKGIRENFVPGKNNTFDYELRDMHCPEYRISAEYKGITGDLLNHHDYEGAMKLNYCDKSIDISNEQRTKLLDELDASLEKKYADEIQSLLNPEKRKNMNFEEIYARYHKDPEVIGRSILASPSSLRDQIEIINTSMPYGIKLIMDKLTK